MRKVDFKVPTIRELVELEYDYLLNKSKKEELRDLQDRFPDIIRDIKMERLNKI